MTEGSAVATTLWVRSFVDELARHGVREVVLAPGSRSTPLVMACVADGRLRLRVHLDERSAAFFALGVGRASGRPAAVVTTSGTAAANLFPAVVEASMAGVPLLVLTADRPHHLRDSDANQAIDQVRLYGTYARESFDLAPPALSDAGLRHLRALAGRAVAASIGPPAGPVHVNLPFDKPLEPADGGDAFAAAHELAARGRQGGRPFVEIGGGRPAASPEEIDRLAALLDTPRGVIVAGQRVGAVGSGGAALRLAAETGFPVLADPLSGARYGPSCGAHRLAAHDLFVGDPEIADILRPSLVLRVGATPTSASIGRWLARADGVPHVVVDGEARWKDYGARATWYLRADAERTLTALAERATGAAAPEWGAAWRAADAAACAALADGAGDPWEGDVLAAVARSCPPSSPLFVSSSMPIRDLDAFGGAREESLEVHGNRGASGIDGIVSTAFGVASQRDAPVVCVIGDIAFFHDQNGLLWSREPDAVVVFVLVDNDGGGIFHMLPIAGHEPHFTEYFATPHGLDLTRSAGLFEVPCSDSDPGELEDALAAALAAGRTSVLRVRTDRRESHARRTALRAAARAAVAEALAALG